jgi:methionyl aminopeptidase
MIVYLKTREEIEGFKRAGKLAANVLSALLKEAETPGICPKDLDNMAKQLCENAGAKSAFHGYEGYPAHICVSVNETLVHGLPDNKPFEKHDIVGIDVGVEIDGFIGDTAETICYMSECDSTYSCPSHLVLSCRDALLVAINKAKNGNMLSEIGKAISKVAKERNYKIPREYGGHGMNRYKMHAPPFVSNRQDNDGNIKLRPGMIICIEPMFVDGDPKTKVSSNGWNVEVGGMSSHCEHTVLVTENEPIVLTRRENERILHYI